MRTRKTSASCVLTARGPSSHPSTSRSLSPPARSARRSSRATPSYSNRRPTRRCSACSRVYVDRLVKDRLLDRLVERTRSLKMGNPLVRDVAIGPVINEEAVRRFEAAVAQAQAEGGRILAGGRRRVEGELANGYF